MGTGYCAAWDVVDLGEPNRGPGACNILSQDAQMGACDLGSSSCEVCGALAPVCAFCADPADPSKGRCVPINSDAQVI